MDGILRLAKTYSKKKHTNILPCCDVNILENLHFLYDEDWENQSTILTYLFDCYSVGRRLTTRIMCSNLVYLT